jgi:hypothetical protein
MINHESSSLQFGAGVEFVQRHPDRFLYPHSHPTGQVLASRLSSMLIWLGALPVHVDCVRDLWLICAGMDWLSNDNGNINYNAFCNIVPFPELMPNSHREEILISAFAESAGTMNCEFKFQNIKGGMTSADLPTSYFNEKRQCRRILAFTMRR